MAIGLNEVSLATIQGALRAGYGRRDIVDQADVEHSEQARPGDGRAAGEARTTFDPAAQDKVLQRVPRQGRRRGAVPVRHPRRQSPSEKSRGAPVETTKRALCDCPPSSPVVVHIPGPKLALDSITDGFPAGMEAELFHDGSVFEKYGLYNKDVMTPSTAEIAGHPASGFTPTDLAALNELSVAALGQQRWSRCQVVHEPFADYLAAWAVDAGHSEPPHLAIARFKRTGTYALTVGQVVVATAPSLSKILTAIRQVLAGGEAEAATIA
jgi:hypothetical protein